MAYSNHYWLEDVPFTELTGYLDRLTKEKALAEFTYEYPKALIHTAIWKHEIITYAITGANLEATLPRIAYIAQCMKESGLNNLSNTDHKIHHLGVCVVYGYYLTKVLFNKPYNTSLLRLFGLLAEESPYAYSIKAAFPLYGTPRYISDGATRYENTVIRQQREYFLGDLIHTLDSIAPSH